MEQSLAVVLRPTSAAELADYRVCRDCLGHAPLRSFENRAVLPVEPDDLWKVFAHALSALAPRFTKTMSFMRMFNGDKLGFGEDDGPECGGPLLLGTLKFTSRDRNFKFSVTATKSKVTVSATPPGTSPSWCVGR
jgi:hypothetical protein